MRGLWVGGVSVRTYLGVIDVKVDTQDGGHGVDLFLCLKRIKRKVRGIHK